VVRIAPIQFVHTVVGTDEKTHLCLNGAAATRRHQGPVFQRRMLLSGSVDYLRMCVTGKVQGVSESLGRTPRVASGTNLLGLLKHLTDVERYTSLGEKARPSTFHARPDESLDSLVAAYRDAITRANDVIAADHGRLVKVTPSSTSHSP
jgi:hypothetical protein